MATWQKFILNRSEDSCFKITDIKRFSIVKLQGILINTTYSQKLHISSGLDTMSIGLSQSALPLEIFKKSHKKGIFEKSHT